MSDVGKLSTLTVSERKFLAESNCIEGFCYLPEKYTLEAAMAAGRGEKTHLINSIEAWNYVRAHVNKEITVDDILLLHQYQMRGLMRDHRQEGVLRSGNVTVSGLNAANSNEIRVLLQHFVQNFNKSGGKAAKNRYSAEELHALFECIHPFWDGNGRVGRLLWAWQVLKTGRFVTPVLAAFAPEHASFGQSRGLYYDFIQNFRDRQFAGVRKYCFSKPGA